MLSLASRGAGPGPSTLAFRLSLANTARKATPVPCCPGQNRSYAVLKFRPKPVIPNIPKPPPIPIVTTLIDPKAVIHSILASCGKKDLKGVVNGWKRLRVLDAVGQITPKGFDELSEYIIRTFITGYAEELFNQNRYLVLEDIAIEAAARDSWRGLYTLFIAALRNGHPAIVANAYEKYKTAIHEVQGKSRSGHVVRDKVQRDESRLEGFGPKPLTYAYLFAMMRLEQINGKVIMSVFETQRSLFSSPYRMMDTVLASILPTMPKTERPIVQRDFYKLIDTAIFVLNIWHPPALLRTMRDFDFNQDWPALKKLYDRFLDLSIGPNKLIHAYDLHERERDHYDEVPFTTAVWLRFIAYMKRSGDLAGLKDMLEKQMPLRKLKPSALVYRAFLISFAYLARRPDTSIVIKQQAVEAAEDLWGEINRIGIPINDDLLSGRIESLSMYDPVSVPALYQVISNGSFPQAGIKTLTCLVNYFMRQGQADQALEIIRAGLEGRGIAQPHKTAFTSVIKLAAQSQYRGKESERLVLAALDLKPAKMPLDPASVGLVLAHMLAWGYKADRVVTAFRQSIMESEYFNMIDCWEVAITSMLTRYQDRHETTESEFFVAVKILGLTRDEPPRNITHYTAQLLWSKIFRRLIASSLSQEKRAELLDLCVDSFPPPESLQFVPDRFLAIIEDALIRPRRDRIAEAKGLVEWYLERSKIYTGDRRLVTVGYVQLCVKHGEYGLALNMLEEHDSISNAGKKQAQAVIAQVTRGRHVNAAVLDELRLAMYGQSKSKDDRVIVEPEPETEGDRDGRGDDRVVAGTDGDFDLDGEDYA